MNKTLFSGLTAVGLVLSLDTPEQARQLKLTLTAPGADLTVYATNDDRVPDRFDGGGWHQVRDVPHADQRVTVKLTGGPERHYLIWFTNLPPAGGGYRIGIAEAVLSS